MWAMLYDSRKVRQQRSWAQKIRVGLAIYASAGPVVKNCDRAVNLREDSRVSILPTQCFHHAGNARDVHKKKEKKKFR